MHACSGVFTCVDVVPCVCCVECQCGRVGPTGIKTVIPPVINMLKVCAVTAVWRAVILSALRKLVLHARGKASVHRCHMCMPMPTRVRMVLRNAQPHNALAWVQARILALDLGRRYRLRVQIFISFVFVIVTCTLAAAYFQVAGMRVRVHVYTCTRGCSSTQCQRTGVPLVCDGAPTCMLWLRVPQAEQMLSTVEWTLINTGIVNVRCAAPPLPSARSLTVARLTCTRACHHASQALGVLFLIAAACVYGHMANDAATKQAEMCMDHAFRVEQVRRVQPASTDSPRCGRRTCVCTAAAARAGHTAPTLCPGLTAAPFPMAM